MPLTLDQATRAGQIAAQMPALQAAIDDLQAKIAARLSFKTLHGTLSDGSTFSTLDLGLGDVASVNLFRAIGNVLNAQLVALRSELQGLG